MHNSYPTLSRKAMDLLNIYLRNIYQRSDEHVRQTLHEIQNCPYVNLKLYTFPIITKGRNKILFT
jgi:hypothetical protein